MVFLEGLKAFWSVFTAMAPWLLVGFLVAGMIAVWMPRAFVMKMMGGALGFRGVLRAVLIGVPLPICSCGVIPISTALRKAGAGKGPTAGFLIATPQTGIDSILATYALLGPFFAVARPLAAFLTGLMGGGIVQVLTANDPPDAPPAGSGCGAGPAQRGIRAVLWQGYVRILGGVVKPLFTGLLVSALVTVLLPDDFFTEFLRGREWAALPLMAIVGIPMYVCSTAAIPIAAALVMKGLSPGAAFVFLMTGPAVNAVSIATISSLIGKCATVAYMAVIIFGAVFFGAVTDFIPGVLPVDFTAVALQEQSVPLYRHLCGAVLASLMAYALVFPPDMKK